MERLNKILPTMEALLNEDTSMKLNIFADPVKTSKFLKIATGTLVEDPVKVVIFAINKYIELLAG